MQKVLAGAGHHGREPGGHLVGTAHLLGIVAGEVEIARMGPEGEALLIERHQCALAIDDRTALAQGRYGVGLERSRPGLQLVPLHELEPGQATS